ncbi:glycosyltransferase [Mycobacterium sp. 1081908.1]|uniref:glycosyltransferase n=1 Tax=Mycobacterium sp. 1081908.1 TaxID=1834066 RepID=UPI000801B858|nr:glycosyltransferase [Mycobacterium sp. 1081908.1]OBK45106.1 glycosyl transferase family 1 [Mycobacterium sp. 1081908.1]
MKFVLANWGTRGEVEPYVTVGRELVRRGHDVHMAVAPEMVGFTEAAGPTAVAYGPELKAILDPHRDFWAGLFTTPWKVRELGRLSAEYSAPLSQCRAEVSATLTSLAQGADLLLTGMNFEDDALNAAEYCGIPLATLHIFPLRANGRLLPYLPAPLARAATRTLDWLAWRGGKTVEDAQRREFGLPEATRPWPRRIAERGSLEIQAYDEVCYPGLAAEWAKFGGRRPFVGALTMELPTDADEEVASWIAAGTPPICFGFGSVGVESAADTLAMISSACAQLGERALVCAAGSDYSNVAHSEHVKVVGVMNYAAALPACRAFVHHGGCGTTNAGLRAGLPTLILWTLPDQGLWGARVKRLKVGTGRRFSATTEKSLVADLRTVLAPECLTNARELAARMTKPAESVAVTADLVENFARLKRVG